MTQSPAIASDAAATPTLSAAYEIQQRGKIADDATPTLSAAYEMASSAAR